MKTILFLLLATMLTGCSSLGPDQVTAYRDAGTPDPIYARIRARRPLSLPDVVELSHTNLRSSAIIVYLSISDSHFNLTQEDIQNLRREGVSGDVITYMRERPDETGSMFSTFNM